MLSSGDKELKAAHRSFNVNEEYLSAFRTKSYADFFSKAELLVNDTSSPPLGYSNICGILLEPRQETVATVLESEIFSKQPDLKSLLLKYFETSAEASRICSYLLASISQILSNYQFIQQALDMGGDCSPEQFKITISELNLFILHSNPFSNPHQHDFKRIHDQYSSVLHHLRSMSKKVARKIKLIKYFKQAAGVGVTAACGVATVTAVILAAHTLVGLVMGPAIFSFPLTSSKVKLFNLGFLQGRFLSELRKQLDVAAKGTYILNRDFDTMTRLVERLHDEIEHHKAMIQFCLDRREDRFPMQEVLKELSKNDMGFKKQVEELEQQLHLCLFTINRVRVSVIKEMVTSSV
ncbi:hypothetical protein NE237_026955 [Protea cynaroides]|uniref:Uncharacterized protein n=1 Tax=Protea cynaroides TaxID=273540 RepID=A0A9Q0GP83_9MAGN|nr:hypothetical protein NE237_026955 [Protea cynaroides]